MAAPKTEPLDPVTPTPGTGASVRSDSFILIDSGGKVVGRTNGCAGSSVHCWEVLDGLLGEGLRASCAHCAIGTAAHGGDPAVYDTREPVTPRCTVVPQAGPGGGALVWMRSPFEDPAGPEAALARLLVQGGLAQALATRDVGLALEVLRGVLGAEDVELFVTDPSGELVMFECRGLDADALEEERRYALGEGLPGQVLAKGEPIATRDLPADPRDLRAVAEARGLRAWAAVPLPDDGGVTGVLEAAWRNPDAPLERAMELLRVAVGPLADLVAASRRRVGSAPVAPEPARSSTPRPMASMHPSLEIRCLGPLEVWRAGERVPTEEFGRRRALTLLGMLSLTPGQRVPRDAIVDDLWPGADRAAGANRLYGLVHTLRRAVDPDGSRASWIRCRGGTYWLEARPTLEVDLHDFYALLTRAAEVGAGPAGDRLAADLLEEAIGLRRGELFEGEPEVDWYQHERARFHEAYLDALHKLAELRVRLGEPDWALEPLRQALGYEPLREDLHRQLIDVLAGLGRSAEAAAQYQACRDLLDQRGLSLAPETVDLAQRLSLPVT